MTLPAAPAATTTTKAVTPHSIVTSDLSFLDLERAAAASATNGHKHNNQQLSNFGWESSWMLLLSLPFDHVFVQDLKGHYLYRKSNSNGELGNGHPALESLCRQVTTTQETIHQRISPTTNPYQTWDVTVFPIRDPHASSSLWCEEVVAIGGLIQVITTTNSSSDVEEEKTQDLEEEQEETIDTNLLKNAQENFDCAESHNAPASSTVLQNIIQDSATTCYALVDPHQGTLLEYNRSFQVHYNVKEGDRKKTPLLASYAPHLYEQLQKYLASSRTTAIEADVPLPDQTWRHCRISPPSSTTPTTCVLLEEWDITNGKLMEQELADYQLHHERFLEHLPIGYSLCELITDDDADKTPIDYSFLEINRPFEEMTSLAKESTIGRTVIQAIPGIQHDPSDWIGRFGKVVQSQTVSEFTQYSEPLQRWYKGIAYPLSPNSQKFVVMFVDYSENHASQQAIWESEERHRSLFENMNQGVVYHDADGHTTDTNQAALRILGLTMDQMLGKEIIDPQWKFCYEDGSTMPAEEYPAAIALQGKPVTNLIMGVKLPNQEEMHWLQLDAMPRFRPGEDKPYQAYTTFSDITQAKQLEHNLLRAKEKAEEADQLKSAFLATISHEIRTPLNGIMGHLELILSNGLSEESHDENLEGLQVALQSGKLLIAIILDILDLSKIEAGQFDILRKPIPIRELLADTIKLANAYRIQRQKEQIQLSSKIEDSISDWIYGDPCRLQQILNNLLSNAIKFTDQGEVSLSVRRSPDDRMIEFCIHDTGKGIPADRKEIIFEPFRQVDFVDTRKHGGTGLGLTICKRLVEIMGGKLWVVSSDDKETHGSSFYFTIPYQVPPFSDDRPEKTVTHSSPTLRSQRSPGKILVAEDDPVSRKIAMRMLQKAGYVVIAAEDGAVAVSLFEQHRSTIDFVLMDVQMPNLDGLDATMKIRELEAESDSSEMVPIVALSAGAMKGDREKGLEAGMNDYLCKPVCRAELLQTLEKYLGSQE